MKKQIMQNLKKFSPKGILPAILMGVMAFSFIPSSSGAQSLTTNSRPAVKYVGKENDQIVFQVDFDNNTDETFILSIKDADGNLLYTDHFKDKKFTKKFRFDEEPGNMKLTFIVTTDKEKLSQVFLVNTNTRIINDVVVTRQ